jgi:hypothetical protein
VALDLSGVRRIVEKLLDDELQLWRDLDGVVGDTLDDETGKLKPGPSTARLMWEGAGAIVRPGQLTVSLPLDSAIAPQSIATAYQAMLPLAAPQTAVDDVLRVSRSLRDPLLADRRFRVTDVGIGTFLVVRVLRLEPDP